MLPAVLMLWLRLRLSLLLHRVHKPLLGTVEDDDGKEHCDAKHDESVHQTGSIKGSDTEAAVLECLEYRSEGIQVYYPLIFLRCKAQRIYDWSRIHEKLDAELDEESQIPVFCCP